VYGGDACVRTSEERSNLEKIREKSTRHSHGRRYNGNAEASGPEAARLWQSLIVDEFNLAQKQNYQPSDDLRGREGIPTSSHQSDIIDIPVPSRPTADGVPDTYLTYLNQLVYRVRLVTRHRVALAFGLVA
jgi:hypothetical protein